MTKYLYITLFALTILLSGLFLYQREEIRKYKELYNKELQNVEAYRISNSGLEGELRQYQMTMNDLRSSKDTLDQKFIDAINKLKIKDKQIEYLQYQSTIAHKTDTISMNDTIFVQELNVDTIIQDEWYKLQLGLKYPSDIIVSPTFNSEKIIIVNSKKEYNSTPSKIFFIRWFQKKHLVVEVNIEEKSPYIQNRENKFIKIIK